jgi:uncharacterized phiE125 gp8 family phage protein
MRQQTTVYAQPTEEPVSLEEAKAHLRVDGSEEDALIARLIRMARESCEMKARRAFISRTVDLHLTEWPLSEQIEFADPPLQTVTSISYTDDAGVTATVPATDYVIYSAVEPGLLVLKGTATWPSVNLMPGPSIVVRYVAGYASAAAVPAIYKQAILLTIVHLYENREAVVVGTITTVLPQAAESLLMIDRVSWY